MKQVVQSASDGKLKVKSLPDPMASPGQVLVATAASVISAGTEKSVMELASKSLLGKALERPDQARRIAQKIRSEGLFDTLRQVREKLDEPIPLGYSSAGVVVASGQGVRNFNVGDRVATNGPHAGIVSVPVNLCAFVPDNVAFEHGAFAVIGSIAMQGCRLARVSLGETVLVIGLGLIGQLAVQILAAAGCRVIGTDPDASKCQLAKRCGATSAAPGVGESEILQLTRGLGADAVLITASTDSNGPIELAAAGVRPKGRIVLVGVVGLDLPRRPFYFKEAEFVVSCSYGPGRYDDNYEARGIDYPPAHVRWTEQRNIQAVLDLMSAGKLNVAPLITHHFKIDEAEKAFEMVRSGSESYLGIVLQYPPMESVYLKRKIVLGQEAGVRREGKIGLACLGAGNFARLTLLPTIARIPDLDPRLLCAASGLSSGNTAERFGFTAVSTDEDAVFADKSIDAVLILTRHNKHANQVIKGLSAGKHVFVEKPLALTLDEMEQVETAMNGDAARHPILMVGFNRRFSEAARLVKEHFQGVHTPLTVSCRFNAGELPAESWPQNMEEGGGRIIGEACHGIDLATFLVGSPPVRVFAESIGGPDAPLISDDQVFLTIRHANGAVSNIAYLAGGDKAMPKERIEVLGGGRMAVIDDFSSVKLAKKGRLKEIKTKGKGHFEEMQSFAAAILNGATPPIAWEDLRAVSLAAIAAVQSLREGIPIPITPI